MDDKQIKRQDQKLDCEIDKLNLEIKNLRKKNRWEGIAPVISVVTVLLTVVGLILGFNQWITEQELQRTAQEQERAAQYLSQLRSDLNEISRFTQDKSLTLSRVSFLLDDINKVLAVASKMTDTQLAVQFEGYKRTVTEGLVKQIINDTNFMESSRDVAFAATIAQDWNDYPEYLKQKEQLDVLDTILYRYVRALRHLRDNNASYFKQISYDSKGQRYVVSGVAEQTEGEEALFQHFRRILEGFKEHLTFLSNDPQAINIKKQKINEFGDAVCIKSVAEHILEKEFSLRSCMTQ